MNNKYVYQAFLLVLAYIVFSSGDYKIIIGGIAIFLIGMIFMEDGFKLFTGGLLERFLEKSTKTLTRAISTYAKFIFGVYCCYLIFKCWTY